MNRSTAMINPLAKRKAHERRMLVWLLAITVPLTLVVLVLLPQVGPVFRIFTLRSVSMAPTLPRGSHAVVSRAAYGYSRHSFDLFELPIKGRQPALMPKRGDIVAFRLKSRNDIFLIKRIVGLPGDEISLNRGMISINGRTIARKQIASTSGNQSRDSHRGTLYQETLPEGVSYHVVEFHPNSFNDTMPTRTVPAEHVYVLGDNRDRSLDSRNVHQVGFVPINQLIGKVVWYTHGG